MEHQFLNKNSSNHTIWWLLGRCVLTIFPVKFWNPTPWKTLHFLSQKFNGTTNKFRVGQLESKLMDQIMLVKMELPHFVSKLKKGQWLVKSLLTGDQHDVYWSFDLRLPFIIWFKEDCHNDRRKNVIGHGGEPWETKVCFFSPEN